MNRLRFGALLLMRGQRFGLYLSHRVVLTVPKPGRIRATALKDFQPSQIITVNGIALAFFKALCKAASSDANYASSFDMIKKLLELPENMTHRELFAFFVKKYGVKLEPFSVPVPSMDSHNNQEKLHEQM